MTDIVVTDQTFGGVHRERELARRHALTFAHYQLVDEAETAAAVVGARVVFANFAPISERVLAGLACDGLVVRYGVGYDNVDIKAANKLGIRVCNVPDYGIETVADHTVALILSLLRRLPALDRAIRDRSLPVEPTVAGRIRGLEETVVGLLGAGRIGAAVAARLLPFGVRILATDPYLDPSRATEVGVTTVDLDELLREAHLVSLHLPLSDNTAHVINADTLDQMRPGSYLVNTARGGLVDEHSLVEALRSGHLAGAALDVFEREPLPEDSAFRALDNVLLTPHAAFYSDSSLAALQKLAVEEAERALLGLPLRCEVT